MILWCISWMRSYAVLHVILSVRCLSRGWDRRRCCRHKEGVEDVASLMKFLIIPPPLAQGGVLNAIWVSALYGATSMKYIFPFLSVPLSFFPPPPRLFLSLCSNWRCSKGVWGQCLLKVRPPVRLTLVLPFRCIYQRMWSCLLLQLPNFCFAHKTHSPKSTVCTSNNLTHSSNPPLF